MKKVIYTLAISLSTLVSFAQVSEKREYKDFNKIQAEGASNIILKQGEPFSVEVKGDEKDLKNLITDVNGTTLYIGTKGNIDGEIKVYVTMKDLSSIVSSGASVVTSDSSFNCDKLSINASGASKVKIDIIAKEVQSTLTGAANTILSGAAEVHICSISGAASLKSYKLTTVNTNLTASGASSAKVNVNQKFNAVASGASTLKYIGEPSDKIINASGSAEVKQVDAGETNIKLNDIDTTKIKWGNKKYMIIDEDNGNDFNVRWNTDFQHWQGIELNLNGLMGTNGSTSLPASSDHMSINYGLKSLSWNLNLIEKDFHIYKDYVNLVTGIGFGFNTYQFKNPIRLNPDSSYTNYFKDSTITFNKNKLKTSYVQIPLMIEFNTSSEAHKSFHLAAGVIGGYKLGSKTLRTYEINGYKFEEKRKDDYNINPFKLDATVRIGYGAFTMFGNYSLTPLFENNKGPELNSFSVGVRIIPF